MKLARTRQIGQNSIQIQRKKLSAGCEKLLHNNLAFGI